MLEILSPEKCKQPILLAKPTVAQDIVCEQERSSVKRKGFVLNPIL